MTARLGDRLGLPNFSQRFIQSDSRRLGFGLSDINSLREKLVTGAKLRVN